MSWLDAHLAAGWRLAHKWWSMRLTLLWAVVSGLWVAIPAFQGLLPPVGFAALCVGFSVAIMGARLTKQPGLTV